MLSEIFKITLLSKKQKLSRRSFKILIISLSVLGQSRSQIKHRNSQCKSCTQDEVFFLYNLKPIKSPNIKISHKIKVFYSLLLKVITGLGLANYPCICSASEDYVRDISTQRRLKLESNLVPGCLCSLSCSENRTRQPSMYSIYQPVRHVPVHTYAFQVGQRRKRVKQDAGHGHKGGGQRFLDIIPG